jgi:GT2 family glycosyltransferase
MNAATPRPALIVVNYASHGLIAEGLDAEGLRLAGIRVFIVDNYSTQEERTAVERLCAERAWTMVSRANEGFGAGVNRGVAFAAQAGCDPFITLNPDAKADPAVLSALAQRVLAQPGRMASPRMVTSDGAAHFRGSTVSLRTGDPEWKNWLSGACLAFSRAAFTELGGFDEDYFLYWEDLDLSRRAASAGIELQLCDDLEVVHDEGGTQGPRRGRAKSPYYYFYNTRNRLLFASRQVAGRRLWGWITSTPRQSLLIWLRGGRRQLLAEPAGALAATAGTLAGLARAVPSAFGDLTRRSRR